jgi:nucleotide-binding universal stress UspA family protein
MDTLLIPTDGSDASKDAIRHGLALAKSLGARVVVLRVAGKPAHIVVMGIDLTDLPESVRAEIARRTADHFAWVDAEARTAGVTCETRCIEADAPWQGIIETADASGASLIVMASHRRAGALPRLVGSETMKVLTASTRPVLVLK